MNNSLRRLRRWSLRILAVVAVAGILVNLVAPKKAQSQIGIDPCCITTAVGLGTLNALTGNLLATPLNQVMNLKDEFLRYQEEEIWTARSIALGRGFAGYVNGILNRMRNVLGNSVRSAKLSLPQTFEAITLSRDSARVPQVDQAYEDVYGVLPASTEVSPDLREQIDMCDAAAKGAIKRALAIDALAEEEMAILVELNREIARSAPGTAPMLEASAAAHLIRANAFTQAALADLTRLRGIVIADETADMKRELMHSVTDKGRINQILTRD